MKFLVVILAFVALAECLPSPDAMVPEVAVTQEPGHAKTHAEHHQEAKATVQSMMEAGSTGDACGELADSLIKEVEANVASQQAALNAFHAPNDGTSCASEGQDAVTAAQKALDDGKAAADAAVAASAAAASAPVNLGTVSLAALSVHSGVVCSMPADEDPYQTAHAAALVAAADATEKQAAVPGLEEALETTQAEAAELRKVCECNVFASYNEAWTAATSHAAANTEAYTKGKHMKCVLAGDSHCEVGDVPAVTAVTLAVDGSDCQKDGDFKIEGGGDSGRLMFYREGKWGTVCDDMFDSNDNGATVACKAMGYQSGVNINYCEDTGGCPEDASLPIWLDDITCSGSEATLTDCPSTRYMTNNEGCAHSEDVGVTCSHSARSTIYKIETGSNSGRLMFFYHGKWGTVCDDNFDSNNNGATVACKSMGYSGGVNINYCEDTGACPEDASLPIWLDDITCSGSEAQITDCPSTRYMTSNEGCSHAEDVGVTCH
jgi:hypothetical protein